MDFVTPVGFRDIMSDEALLREEMSVKLQQLFSSYGFRPVETPTLEMLEVMESGGHVPQTPFKFFDSHGDLLAMRPDVTMQIARMVATRVPRTELPLKLRYTQRVFREHVAEATAREQTQVGVEVIKADTFADCSSDDADLVSLFAEALSVCGLKDFKIALGSACVLRYLLLYSGAPQWWQDQVLQAYHTSNYVQLEELVQHPCADTAIAAAIGKLPSMRGGREALQEVRKMLEPLECTGGLDELEAIYDTLSEKGLADKLLLDFSVISSLDYYTGIVFEAYAPTLGSALGGGGRYDGLISKYGAADTSAAGFAFYLEQVMEALSIEERLVRAERKEREDRVRALMHNKDRLARQAMLSLSQGIPGVSDLLNNEAGQNEGDPQSAAEGATDAAVPADPDLKIGKKRPLRVAVPKGSLNEGAIKVLEEAGLDVTGLANAGRTLMLSNGDVEYIIVRPTDAPYFVALGVADCGICGEDSLVEQGVDVVELVDLHFGGCKFVVAEKAGTRKAVEERYRTLGSIRVATKYPNITRWHFGRMGMQVEIMKLHGNVELAPITGMAERIVDITATGTTLRENDLEVVEDVLESTARFFANPCSFRTNPRVGELAKKLLHNAKRAQKQQES